MPASLPPRFSSAHSKPPLKDYRPCIYAWSPITCIESRHDSFDHGELHSCTAPGAPKADSIINVSQITKRYLESPRELKRNMARNWRRKMRSWEGHFEGRGWQNWETNGNWSQTCLYLLRQYGVYTQTSAPSWHSSTISWEIIFIFSKWLFLVHLILRKIQIHPSIPKTAFNSKPILPPQFHSPTFKLLPIPNTHLQTKSWNK